MSSIETTGGRGERRGRRPARASGDIAQLPFKQPRSRLSPVELVSADELESIHEASLTILEEIGMDVLLPEAREIYRAAGARIDGLRVRADRGMVLDAVAKAPERYKMHARNPARTLEVGGDYMMFSPVASPPNCSDLERGRRSAAGPTSATSSSLASTSTSCTSPAGTRSSRSISARHPPP